MFVKSPTVNATGKRSRPSLSSIHSDQLFVPGQQSHACEHTIQQYHVGLQSYNRRSPSQSMNIAVRSASYVTSTNSVPYFSGIEQWYKWKIWSPFQHWFKIRGFISSRCLRGLITHPHTKSDYPRLSYFRGRPQEVNASQISAGWNTSNLVSKFQQEGPIFSWVFNNSIDFYCPVFRGWPKLYGLGCYQL